jgi:hypothetical protein
MPLARDHAVALAAAPRREIDRERRGGAGDVDGGADRDAGERALDQEVRALGEAEVAELDGGEAAGHDAVTRANHGARYPVRSIACASGW